MKTRSLYNRSAKSASVVMMLFAGLMIGCGTPDVTVTEGAARDTSESPSLQSSPNNIPQGEPDTESQQSRAQDPEAATRALRVGLGGL